MQHPQDLIGSLHCLDMHLFTCCTKPLQPLGSLQVQQAQLARL